MSNSRDRGFREPAGGLVPLRHEREASEVGEKRQRSTRHDARPRTRRHRRHRERRRKVLHSNLIYCESITDKT